MQAHRLGLAHSCCSHAFQSTQEEELILTANMEKLLQRKDVTRQQERRETQINSSLASDGSGTSTPPFSPKLKGFSQTKQSQRLHSHHLIPKRAASIRYRGGLPLHIPAVPMTHFCVSDRHWGAVGGRSYCRGMYELSPAQQVLGDPQNTAGPSTQNNVKDTQVFSTL